MAKGDLRLQALEHTGTIASQAEYQRIIDSIKKDNLEKVFINFDIPFDNNGYSESQMAPFPDFVSLHQRFSATDQSLFLGSKPFFNYCKDKDIKPFIYEANQCGLHSFNFTTTLMHSNNYIGEARICNPVSGEYDTESSLF